MEPYRKLEQKYASFVGAERGVSCSSGTASLHLALLALGIKAGDEVIVPDFTMAACAFAVSYTGATPVFVDVSLRDYTVDIAKVEKAITPRTKAIMIVHVYGRVVPLAPFKKFNLPIIEDASEAHGAVYRSIAEVTCWSFYENKIIHAEEGGMLTTNLETIATKAAYLKNMTFNANHDYYHEEIGFNYRMPNAMAIMVLRSMKQYPQNAKKRRKIESWYAEILQDNRPPRDAVWFYDTEVPNRRVAKRHHAVREGFKPLSSFPMYGGNALDRQGMPNATEISKKVILLPVRPGMKRGDVEEVCKTLLT